MARRGLCVHSPALGQLQSLWCCLRGGLELSYLAEGACQDECYRALQLIRERKEQGELEKPAVLAAMCDMQGWNDVNVPPVFRKLLSQPHSMTFPTEGNSFFDDFWNNLVVYLDNLVPYLEEHRDSTALHAVIGCVRQDKQFAEQLQQSLRDCGLNTKICYSKQQCSAQAEQASVFLPIVTPAFHKSQHMKEVTTKAYELRMRAVPIQLNWPENDCQDPFLSRFVHLHK